MRKGIILLILVIMVLCGAGSAEALTEEKIPTNNTVASPDTRLKTGLSNAVWEINPAYRSQVTYSGGSFYIPRNRTGASRTYTDLITVTYKDAGKINGRSIDVKMNIDKLVQTKELDSRTTDKGEFLKLWSEETSLSSYKMSGKGYKCTHTIDVSYEITYGDSGEIVEYPFFQAAVDIDTKQNVASVAEGFKQIRGYTRYYTYPACVLIRSGGGFYSPSQLETSGRDSWTKTGLYATTENGSFKSTHYLTNCRTEIYLFNQYAESLIDRPSLSVDSSRVYRQGEEILWEVKQRIGEFFVTVMSPYDSFSISDDIPGAVSYKSAEVTDEKGRNVTHLGTLKYDESKREVTFRFGEEFLRDKSVYDGSVYTMRIKTEAEAPREPVETVQNTARSEISGIIMETNLQAVTIAAPELSVQKTNTGKEYYRGERVTYKITFSQRTEGVTAENAALRDILPEGLRLDRETVSLTGLEEGEYTVKFEDNGYEINIERLEYGEYTLTYEAKVDAEDRAQTLTNTAVITASNAERKEHSSNIRVMEIPKFAVRYSFVSTDGSPLPQEVIELVPEDMTEYAGGTEVKAAAPEKDQVDGITGLWIFEGYDREKAVIEGENLLFTGAWKYTEYPAVLSVEKKASEGVYYHGDEITYTVDFAQELEGIEGKNVILKDRLPEGLELDEKSLLITGLEKDMYEAEITDNEILIKIPSLGFGEYSLIYKAEAATGQNAASLTNTAVLSADNGRETVTATETVDIQGRFGVEYDFRSADETPLPEAVERLVPEDKGWYRTGETAKAKEPEKTEVILDEGMWKFEGYETDEKTVEEENVSFSGSWRLSRPELSISKDHDRTKAYYSGDIAEYEIAFSQNTKGAYGLDVRIIDIIPEGERVLEDSIAIRGVEDYETRVTDKGFEIIIDRLEYGDYTLTYQCEINGPDREQTLVNTAEIKASNVENSQEALSGLTVLEIPKLVKYEFCSDNGKRLPLEVTALVPEDGDVYYRGDVVRAVRPEAESVKVTGGTWRFTGYDKEKKTVEDNVLFVGTWTYTMDIFSKTGDSILLPALFLTIMAIAAVSGALAAGGRKRDRR